MNILQASLETENDHLLPFLKKKELSIKTEVFQFIFSFFFIKITFHSIFGA